MISQKRLDLLRDCLVGLVLAAVKIKADRSSVQGMIIYKAVFLYLVLSLIDTGQTFQGILTDTIRLWIGMQLLYSFVHE